MSHIRSHLLDKRMRILESDGPVIVIDGKVVKLARGQAGVVERFTPDEVAAVYLRPDLFDDLVEHVRSVAE